MDLINFTFMLLVIYQVKHFLFDYPFQTDWMLGKFKPGWDFLGPLATHAGLHGLATFIIVQAVGFDFFSGVTLGLFDFVVHFTMDRLKAGPKYLGRFKPLSPKEYHELKTNTQEIKIGEVYGLSITKKKLLDNKYFWWSIGFDQLVHHCTHYAIIYVLVASKIYKFLGAF